MPPFFLFSDLISAETSRNPLGGPNYILSIMFACADLAGEEELVFLFSTKFNSCIAV